MGILPPLPITVNAKYSFTEDEKQQLGSQLAQKIDAREQIDAEKKSRMSDFKDRIDRASSEIKRLSSNVNLGYEFRNYTCRIEKNYKLKVKEYYDVHSGKLIDTAKFDPQDFQQTFEDKPALEHKKSRLPRLPNKPLDVEASMGQGLPIKTKAELKKEKQKDLESQGTKILKKAGIKKNGQSTESKK